MEKFRVFRINQSSSGISGQVELATLADLSSGDVLIKAAYSSVNYKDALAANGPAKIISQFPLIGGVDVSGTVVNSNNGSFSEGDEVLVTGYEMGMSHHGGYAEYVRVPAEWVVPLPKNMSLRDAMIIGTAGFTAALCLHKMQQNGQLPAQGPMLVTGATGGVGNFAIMMLANRGYDVTALTSKKDEEAYLCQLGASEVMDRQSVSLFEGPLNKALWAGAIDSVGGELLSWLIKTTQAWGNICSVGLAGGINLDATVMPFILRGINLLGITSAGCPTPLRRQIWQDINNDHVILELNKLAITEIKLDDLNNTFDAMLNGETKGRTVVRL